MLQKLGQVCLRGLESFTLIFLLTWGAAWFVCVARLGDYIGQTYSLYPTLPVTYSSLLIDMFPAAFLSGVVAGVIGMLIPSRRWRFVAMAVIFTAGLYVAGDSVAYLFQIDGGAAWGPGEAFFQYIWHPILYPAINLTGLVIIAVIYWRGKRVSQ